MSITRKLKWKRNVEHLKFMYYELESLRELTNSAAPEFQEYYETFCANNNVDRQGLNEEHQDRVSELYGTGEEDPPSTNEDEPDIDCAHHAPIVLHTNPSKVTSVPETVEDREMHEAFSKLFKSIALILHPDRVDKNLPDHIQKDMISRFQLANKAMDEKKYFILLDICFDYDIKPPRNQAQQLKWMKREMENMKQQISKIKSTYSYKFAESDTDTERDTLIEQFLYQLFRFKMPEKS